MGDRRDSDSTAAMPLRPPGMYVRIDGRWWLSTQKWSGATRLRWVELRSENGIDTFRIDPSEVEEVVRVEPEVEYQGFWFQLDALEDAHRGLTWRPMAAGDPAGFIRLRYLGREQGEVASLPGATAHDERSGMGGVTITVRGGDITGYREVAQPGSISPESPEENM